MKKLSIVLAALFIMSFTVKATPNEKVLTAFANAFPVVKDVQWFENETESLAYFITDGVTSKVTFDKEGNFVKSIRYYSEQTLPLNILLNLKKKYADRKVFGVTEVANAEGVMFYIKLTDEKNWYTVKATPDAYFEIIEKFKKQLEN